MIEQSVVYLFCFYSRIMHLDTIKVFMYQLMHNRVALKEY
jgi:hypothetical protein